LDDQQSNEELAESHPKKQSHHASFAVGDSIDSAASEGEDKEEDKEDENPREITYVDVNTDVINFTTVSISGDFDWG
jgi:hypothetical protein